MTFVVRVLVALAAIAFLISNGPSAYRTAKNWINEAAAEKPPGADVTSLERVKELVGKGQREQLVSFHDELQEVAAGSTQRFYALGVGQVTLGAPEAIPDMEIEIRGRVQTEELINPLPRVMSEADCERYPISGSFNNILLFDKKQETFTTVFDKRVSISQYQASCRTSRPALWMSVAEVDTNGDEKLGAGDLEVLYVFALDDKTLHRIQLEGMRIMDVWAVPDVGYLLVQCRVDRNKDGKFGTNVEEPTTIMRIDLKTFVATPFVPADVVTNLQRMLEGRGAEAGKSR
jgi:hypothetical protein